MSGVELANAWRRYKTSGDVDARANIINKYAYLVKITAGRVVSNLPASLDRDDLISAGAVGLIKAVDQFDSGRQVKFETYAIALIRGAILEMLREEDWVPRSVRERVKLLERTFQALDIKLRRPPTEAEVADALDMSVDDLQRMLVEAGRTNLLSLDDVIVGSDGSEKLHLQDVLQDDNASPAKDLELIEKKRMLAESIERLPDREKLVIALYYYEGLTFKEIGKILCISESRVYQLHTQAVIRLRGHLKQDSALFTPA